MIISPSLKMLEKLIRHQIHNLFILDEVEADVISASLTIALENTEYCFRASRNKYYKRNNQVFFLYIILANIAYFYIFCRAKSLWNIQRCIILRIRFIS